MQTTYVPPKFCVDAFHCPHCHVFAEQYWGQPHFQSANRHFGSEDYIFSARCARCARYSFWVDKLMVYPAIVAAPQAHSDLPEAIRADYEEARQIAEISPRGAAALLRLALQKLCAHLGETGKNINDDIGSLVAKGLDPRIQQALDVVRVVGNQAVHPGQIDLRDQPETVHTLFELLNIITEAMIARPRAIDALYTRVVPDTQRQAIARRDGQAPA